LPVGLVFIEPTRCLSNRSCWRMVKSAQMEMQQY
jgi:hypothetical protein